MKAPRPVNSSSRLLLLLLLLGSVGCGSAPRARTGSAPVERTVDSGSRDFITTRYLSVDEALKVVFPESTRIVSDLLLLAPEEREAAQALLGEPLGQRRFAVRIGLRADGRLDGYAVVQNEIGKFKPFTFIVALEPDGSVRRVAVLTYREARGGEIAHRRFLVQYPGKTIADPIDKNRDIVGIQGATMSVDSINHGVRKILAVVQTAYVSNPARVRQLVGGPAPSGSREELASDDVLPAREVTRPTRATATEPGELVASTRPTPNAGSGVDEIGASHKSAPAVVRESRYLMGTLCEIQAFGTHPARLRQAVQLAFAEIEAVEAAISDYQPDSELSRINREAGASTVSVSDTTFDFLRAAAKLAEETGGAFDVTVGPLVDAWGFRSGDPSVPSKAALEELRTRIGHQRVSLSPAPSGLGGRVALEVVGMRLDPGALGKGFAIDRAVARLRAEGIDSARIDFSSTVYALGAPPGESAWTVAVREPGRGKSILGYIDLRNQALAVSGSSEKRFEENGVHYSHILSPFTGMADTESRGAVILAPTATIADGLATAACVLGKKARPILEARHTVEGTVLQWEDGTQGESDRPRSLVRSSGWPGLRLEQLASSER